MTINAPAFTGYVLVAVILFCAALWFGIELGYVLGRWLTHRWADRRRRRAQRLARRYYQQRAVRWHYWQEERRR